MGKQQQGLSRRDFLWQGGASLGALAAAGAFAQEITGKRKVIHIIGYSHIDAAWLWPWRDGADTVLTTFRSALNRISETPGFCYSHSSSAHYRWVERSDPGMLSEIKERTFWLLAGRGGFADLALDRRAEELQTPAEYVMDSAHHGSEGWERSFLEIVPSNVWVLTIKQAEQGKGIVIRVQERSGKKTQARLQSAALGLDQTVEMDPGR